MNFRTFLILDVLVVFLGLTVYELETLGYVGFFEQALSSPATILLSVDLVLSLSLVLVWMWNDSKTSGVPFAPYALIAVGFGVAGPLGVPAPSGAAPAARRAPRTDRRLVQLRWSDAQRSRRGGPVAVGAAARAAAAPIEFLVAGVPGP